MTLAISKAVEEGARAVVCASTGNTSASAAAYAAKAGLTCGVLVPARKVAMGKMAQTLVHGAQVLEVEGNFDSALRVAREVAGRYPVTLVNSVNPFRLQGQKTLAFEVCDALGRAPEYHFVPVGNAGNISAHWIGYSEYLADGVTDSSPHLFGFGTQSLKGLASDALHGHRDGWSPLWSPYRFSDHPPQPGLWAVEPHLGFRGTGAKFEEILVVTDSRDPEQSAFWLDDDLPHVRRWAEDK